VGFGFGLAQAEHHSLVMLPKKRDDDAIYTSEHFAWDESQERRELHFALSANDSKMHVVLPRVKWEGIAKATKARFYHRLRKQDKPTCTWSTGRTPVSRLPGRELVSLAWAIEDAVPALIPVDIRNWLGLSSEEQWWLFTMTNAATGHATSGRGKGWRKAVR
jgi:hypothetical protein